MRGPPPSVISISESASAAKQIGPVGVSITP
jgi:hypothetical protein